MKFIKSKTVLILLFSFALFFNSSAGAAENLQGYYTEEEVRTQYLQNGADKVVIRKSWYTDKMMLKDEAWQGLTIVRFDLDKIFMLDPHTKTYIEVSASFLQNNASNGLADFGLFNEETGKPEFPEDLFVRTEATRQITSWQCYQVMTNPIYRNPRRPYTIFWYSLEVDFPVDVYVNQLKALFGESPEVDGLFNRIKNFEGYPVRLEAHGLNSTVITTLIKIEYLEDIDASIFDIPDDYNGIPLPENMPLPDGR